MSFPYHAVPDGSAALPHHYVTATLAALVPILIVWDNDPRREPWMALCGVLGGLVSFGMVWPRYPVIGASLTLAANAVVLLAPFRPGWREWPRRHAVAVVLLALVALDDSLQHALGWHTPIDAAWKAGGRAAVVDAAEVVVRVV
ncbi:hypothetical protein [Haloarcula sp. CBA1129]|uniref:hypothetical protein n=1 Tax=Haloarcula sp. CBA1129 TaxID=1853684 RepID=UPI001248E8D4|nr:hypothetical protein [Haloarcula sp. CBA1129]KAA9399684.1 hypothetical protein Har1129_16245 [Haloarcula sp. CBA1129]